jgi:hypothetical protein
MDIRGILEKGQSKQNEDHAALERTKSGILRGGSAGCIGTDGRVYGECHRVSLARLLGVDKEVDAERHIMFDAGRTAEDSWADKLTSAGVTFRREEEIQITWPVPGHDNRVVTGRPDIVIGKWLAHDKIGRLPGMFKPEFGLELKGVYSAGTAVRVECEGVPDPKHLAQAAFYSMALGIEYALCYTNPSVWDVPFWAKEIRAAGTKKIQPFYRLFYMRWNADDVLEYRDEHKKHWVATKYAKVGIQLYYQKILGMEHHRELGERPTGGCADGSPSPFSKCNYCPFSKQCDIYDIDKDFDGWLANCLGPKIA